MAFGPIYAAENLHKQLRNLLVSHIAYNSVKFGVLLRYIVRFVFSTFLRAARM